MFMEKDQKEISLQTNTRALRKETSRLLQRLINNTSEPGTTGSLGHELEVLLSIRGMIEHLRFDESRVLIIGRLDPLARSDVHVDLAPYGAHERGVSRLHAKIHLGDDNSPYIIDTGSANGTYLAGQRLQPNIPYLLRDGDRFLLGSLPLQVFFR